jgi:23S rRNA (cytidine1920-2'-O)/16S rRNA (cytidine1409-2'-O)-methyltransferase
MKKQKIRLDHLLTQKGFCTTGNKAKALIMAGNVLVNEQKIDKPGTAVDPESTIRILGDTCPYVSRGGSKLDGALKAFSFDPKDVIALDVGASTGGFTDCLLQRGAKQVIAVDVGHNQIDYKLRTDNRVIVIEKYNAREMDQQNLTEAMFKAGAQDIAKSIQGIQLVVMDVSFISITKILPAIKKVVAPGTTIISLVKPQFEAGRDQIEKGGIVKDPDIHALVLTAVQDAATRERFTILGTCDSPITGMDGNKEFFIHLTA